MGKQTRRLSSESCQCRYQILRFDRRDDADGLPLHGKRDQAGRALHCRRHQTRPPLHPGGRNQPAPVRRTAAHRRSSGRIGQTSPIPVGAFFCSRTHAHPSPMLDPFHEPKGSSPPLHPGRCFQLPTFPFQLRPLRRIIARLFVMGGTRAQSPVRKVSLPGPRQVPQTPLPAYHRRRYPCPGISFRQCRRG